MSARCTPGPSRQPVAAARPNRMGPASRTHVDLPFADDSVHRATEDMHIAVTLDRNGSRICPVPSNPPSTRGCENATSGQYAREIWHSAGAWPPGAQDGLRGSANWTLECNLGPKFAGLVHVHDLDPLSLAKERRMTDQVQDCLPLCPKLSSHGALQAAGEQNADQ